MSGCSHATRSISSSERCAKRCVDQATRDAMNFGEHTHHERRSGRSTPGDHPMAEVGDRPMAAVRSVRDAAKRPAVFLVGAFPPPVHGLANINQAMADLLAGRARIVKFDTAVVARARSSGSWRGFSQLRHVVWLVMRFIALVAVRRPSSIYIGLSGGRGQI